MIPVLTFPQLPDKTLISESRLLSYSREQESSNGEFITEVGVHTAPLPKRRRHRRVWGLVQV